MALLKASLFSAIWIFLWILTGADEQLSCVLKKSCLLPCTFQPGKDVVIHWIQEKLRVHSYYKNQDQPDSQNELFKGRTELFPDQISKGNASLRLSEVKIQDQGRYKCFTSPINGHQKNSFIHLTVYAPVREAKLQQDENGITCSSEEVYPKPELRWSTEPPSNVSLPQEVHVVPQSEGLYDISSSINVSLSHAPQLTYICSISGGGGTRTARLSAPVDVLVSNGETALQCPTSPSQPPSDIEWTFNHSQLIVSRGSVSQEWTRRVKEASDPGRLALHGLSPGNQGLYTCRLRDAGDTFVSSTFLRIHDHSSKILWIIIGSIISCFILGVVIFCLYKHRSKWKKTKKEKSKSESLHLNSMK